MLDLRDESVRAQLGTDLRELTNSWRLDRDQKSETFEQPGAAVFRGVCSLGLEGIVSKRRNAPYRAGRRGDWLKVLNPNYRRT